MQPLPDVFPSTADPVELAKFLWPDVVFYREQKELLYSICDNDETFVPAGNMLGKDFTAAYAALFFFLTRHPCRVLTTSVDGTQLEGVLWGEIRRFLQTSRFPLSHERGGPLIINHLHIRKIVNNEMCGLSYLIGRVAAKGEGMLGHHIAKTGDGIPRTLFIADEASGVEDVAYERADTWADRKLIIGNPYPCMNFFKTGVQGGNKYSANGTRTYRKVIRIRAEDSPNVRLALAQIAAGQIPTGEMLVPGVLSYPDYEKRRDTWDKVRQCIGLDAQFWDGADALMFPPEWLNLAAKRARILSEEMPYRQATSIGIDPAEGGDRTAMCAADEYGIIEIVSKKTPDTGMIVDDAITFMKKHEVEPENVYFDRGGGGKNCADQLRRRGYEVKTVAFGEPVTPKIRQGMKVFEEKVEEKESHYVYVNRRAEMYGTLREKINPSNAVLGDNGPEIYGIPSEGVIYLELRRQLSPIPLLFDKEGRIRMLPKNKPSKNSPETTLIQLLGCSPDEADAVVLAVHGTLPAQFVAIAGAAI